VPAAQQALAALLSIGKALLLAVHPGVAVRADDADDGRDATLDLT
jgi:hypothetical protein